jgi:hypothetical protein
MIATLSEAEMTSAVLRELITGHKLLDEMQHLREYEAAKEANALRGSKTVGALGKQVLNIPQREWFQMREKFGEECWSDREFVKDVQRLEPQFRVHKA